MSGYDDKPGREGLPYGGPFGDTSKDVWGGGFGDTPGGGVGVSELLGFVGESGGIASLSQTLTINSQSVSPSYYYQSKDASTSTWTGTGGTLTGAGSGGLANLDSPTAHPDDRAFDCAGTRRFDGSDGLTRGDKDMVLEAIAQFPSNTGNGTIASTYASSQGFFLKRDGASFGLHCRIFGPSTNAEIISVNGLIEDAWYHIMVFVDVSGSGQMYINGVASGSPVVCSGIGTVTDDNSLVLGAWDTIFYMDKPMAHFALWEAESWLDTHLQAAVAYERYARAFGVWATGATLQSNVRSTAGYMDKVSHVDGIRRLHYQGPGSHRYGRAYDNAFRVGDGYLSETAATNQCLRSQELDNASWSKTRATISANATTAPDGTTTADAIAEDGTAANTHTILQNAGGTNGQPFVLSFYAKAIARHWLRVRLDSSLATVYFDLASSLVGAAPAGSAYDSSGIEYLGDGWHRCWVALSDAGVNVPVTAEIGIAEGNLDPVFNGLSQDSVYVWGVQTEEALRPSSYVPTEGTTVTRTADILEYDVSALSLAEGTIATDLLVDGVEANNNPRIAYITDGGDENNRIGVLFVGVAGAAYTQVFDGGSVEANITDGAASYAGNIWHEHRATWAANDVQQLHDGIVNGTPDTSCTIPSGLDTLNVGTGTGGGAGMTGLVKPRIYSAPTTNNVTDFGVVMANGEIYVSSSAATSLTTTPVIVAGTTTLGEAVDFDMPSDMRLRYTGTATKSFRFGCTITWTGAANETVNATFYKNGSAVSKTTQRREIGLGGDVGNMSVKGAIELAQNDYVELYAAIESGSDTGTVTQMVLICTEAS